MISGVIYCCVGDPVYETYLRGSVRSLRNQGYSGPISVVSDRALEVHSVHLIPAPQFSSPKELKALTCSLSPYTNTLYLDCDVYALEPFEDVWRYLDSGDLALVRGGVPTVKAVKFARADELQYTLSVCQQGAAHYNSGVILWRKTEINDAFWIMWAAEWGRFQDVDELALARAIERTGVTVVELPRKFNFCVDARYRRPEGEGALWHDASYDKSATRLYPELFTS